MCATSSYEKGPAGTAANDLDLMVAALTEAGVDHAVDQRDRAPIVVVASRTDTDNWVEITRQGDGRYVTCGYIGGVADPDDATILAVGPLREIPGVTLAWLGQ